MDPDLSFDSMLDDSSDWCLKHAVLCRYSAEFPTTWNKRQVSMTIENLLNYIRSDLKMKDQRHDHDCYLSAFVKRAALDLIARIGDNEHIALGPVAMQMSLDASWMVRCGAVELMAAIAKNDENIQERLIQICSNDPDCEVRRISVRCLPQMLNPPTKRNSVVAKRTLDCLFAALGDSVFEVRSEARNSLNLLVSNGENLSNEEISAIILYRVNKVQEVRDTATEIFLVLNLLEKEQVLAGTILTHFKSIPRPEKVWAAEILYEISFRVGRGKLKGDYWTRIELLSIPIQVQIQCARIFHSDPEVRRDAASALANYDWTMFEKLRERPCVLDCDMCSLGQSITNSLIIGLKDSDPFVKQECMRMLGRDFFLDNRDAIHAYLELLRDEKDVSVKAESISCLGRITRRRYFDVFAAISQYEDHECALIRRAVKDTQAIFDNSCECLALRLQGSSWEDRIFCIWQVINVYCKRGPRFVQRFCWHDDLARPGDCVFAILRHCLRLYTSIKEMRREVELVGTDGPSLWNESAWTQLELSFSCRINVVDAYTMNTLRKGSESREFLAFEIVQIFVLDGHAYCWSNLEHPDEKRFLDDPSHSCFQHEYRKECKIVCWGSDDGIIGDSCSRMVGEGNELSVSKTSLEANLDATPSHVIAALVDLLNHEDANLQLLAVRALGDTARKGDFRVISSLHNFSQMAPAHSHAGAKAVIRALAQVISFSPIFCLCSEFSTLCRFLRLVIRPV